jgi:hypothetical protein
MCFANSHNETLYELLSYDLMLSVRHWSMNWEQALHVERKRNWDPSLYLVTMVCHTIVCLICLQNNPPCKKFYTNICFYVKWQRVDKNSICFAFCKSLYHAKLKCCSKTRAIHSKIKYPTTLCPKMPKVDKVWQVCLSQQK